MHYIIDPDALKEAVDALDDYEALDLYLTSALLAMRSGEGLTAFAWIVGTQKPKGVKHVGYSPLFEQFWKAYPSGRRTAKGAAYQAWVKLKMDEMQLLKLCLTALNWQKNSRSWLDGFIPLPTTYLNQRRFDDDSPDEMPTAKPMDWDNFE
jgi:hypothetical protein